MTRGNRQKFVSKHLGALTEILKVKPLVDLIEALIPFCDPTRNMFHFSNFVLTLTLEEIESCIELFRYSQN